MRHTLWVLITLAIGCSGNDITHPSGSTWVPVAYVTVQGSPSLHVGDSLGLNVTLRDASGNVVNRAITFTTSDESVATVNDRGVVHAMTAGSVTISASSEGKEGELRLETTAPEGCALGPWAICALSDSYILVAVDEHPLPVPTPFWSDNWDYSGKPWQLISATLTFRVDGSFLFAWTDKWAPETWNQTFVGTYTRTAASALQLSESGPRYSAMISGTGLTTSLGLGSTLTFERR